MSPDLPAHVALPDGVRSALHDFASALGLQIELWAGPPEGPPESLTRLYPTADSDDARPAGAVSARRSLSPREGPELELVVHGPAEVVSDPLVDAIHSMVERHLDLALEIRFFTYEVSERYEEINLLYSISETLGSVLDLDEAARIILAEVCDVLGARRGSLWVFQAETNALALTASVGDEGMTVPIDVEDADAVTARVFREGRSAITSASEAKIAPLGVAGESGGESFLSVPIRYTPHTGEPRRVGVINLIGRRHGGRFTASDQKLLAAIASQIGAALENNRLIRESLARERMAREMELAHNLQMKLLPTADKFVGATVAARVEPAEQVGGDFYQLFKLPEGRVGVMIGDVSSHGFPAALIMALSMSAATIYAAEDGTPSMVLRHVDDALSEELESTEMYLTLFYGVLDPKRGCLTYSNAGHPHAFLVNRDGGHRRLTATDPPVGFAGPGAYGQDEVHWDSAGDLLLLFTDGLSDTLTSVDTGNGEAYVLDRVAEYRDRSPQAILEALFDLTRDVDSSVPSDDRTLIVLRT